MFEPIEPGQSVVERCAAAVRGAIVRGAIAPGERLPPERTLAEQLGVNRLTVRQALARVAAAGLVVARQGSGYVVQDLRRRGGPDLLPELFAMARADGDVAAVAADLLHVRRALARALLERLVTAIDDDGRATVAAAVDAFAAAAQSGDVDAVAAADVEVVAALLDASGSAVMQLCLNPVAAVVRDLPELRRVIYAEPEANLAAYRWMLDWLAAPDPARIDELVGLLAARDDHTVRRLS